MSAIIALGIKMINRVVSAILWIHGPAGVPPGSKRVCTVSGDIQLPSSIILAVPNKMFSIALMVSGSETNVLCQIML